MIQNMLTSSCKAPVKQGKHFYIDPFALITVPKELSSFVSRRPVSLPYYYQEAEPLTLDSRSR